VSAKGESPSQAAEEVLEEASLRAAASFLLRKKGGRDGAREGGEESRWCAPTPSRSQSKTPKKGKAATASTMSLSKKISEKKKKEKETQQQYDKHQQQQQSSEEEDDWAAQGKQPKRRRFLPWALAAVAVSLTGGGAVMVAAQGGGAAAAAAAAHAVPACLFPLLHAAGSRVVAFARTGGLHLVWQRLQTCVQGREVGEGPTGCSMASLLSVFLAKQEGGGREGGREGGWGSFGRQLLSVLAAVVSLWAWARGKWEKMKDWMTAKAMSLQVEGWKDHGKALLLRLRWGAARSGSSLSTTLRLSLDELKSQGKDTFLPLLLEGWAACTALLSSLAARLASLYNHYVPRKEGTKEEGKEGGGASTPIVPVSPTAAVQQPQEENQQQQQQLLLEEQRGEASNPFPTPTASTPLPSLLASLHKSVLGTVVEEVGEAGRKEGREEHREESDDDEFEMVHSRGPSSRGSTPSEAGHDDGDDGDDGDDDDDMLSLAVGHALALQQKEEEAEKAEKTEKSGKEDGREGGSPANVLGEVFGQVLKWGGFAGGESFVVVESEDTKFTSKAEEVQRI
ncbi:hypothetical protein VYU27_009130, partial [Nannochloropsis oceanica]